MCGISGIFFFKGKKEVKKKYLDKMNDVLKHADERTSLNEDAEVALRLMRSVITPAHLRPQRKPCVCTTSTLWVAVDFFLALQQQAVRVFFLNPKCK